MTVTTVCELLKIKPRPGWEDRARGEVYVANRVICSERADYVDMRAWRIIVNHLRVLREEHATWGLCGGRRLGWRRDPNEIKRQRC